MRDGLLPLDDVVDRTVLPGQNYYYLEFVGDSEGKNYSWTQSVWAGWEKDRPNVEIRKARFVNAEWFVEHYKKWGIPLLVINTLDDVPIFLGFGGAAVIVEKVATSVFSQFLEPESVMPRGVLGFASAGPEQREFFKRMPSKKLRMRILKRDKYRCRVCGRSPETSTDIELHVHHIRPSSQRGPTVEENLITLCGTCHGGLDPHFDPALFEFVGVGLSEQTDIKKRIIEGQVHYRKNILAEDAGLDL